MMTTGDFWYEEIQSLKSRLDQIRPFSLNMPMIPSAAIPTSVISQIDEALDQGKAELRDHLDAFTDWMFFHLDDGAKLAQGQNKFSLLKLRFNALLNQTDLFADVLTQRGEHDTGVWLRGLDQLAKDGLKALTPFHTPPPMVCYLDRGHGAAIRRAKTPLPTGIENPVAIIRIPRERMIASGLAASLAHEVGHQAVSLMGILKPLQSVLLQKSRDQANPAWKWMAGWLSEILADIWSLGHLGIGASFGLMGILSLPTYFVHRISNGPHPFPWQRVRLSLMIGKQVFPDGQWQDLEQLWKQLYPTANQPHPSEMLSSQIDQILPEFAETVMTYQIPSMGMANLMNLLPSKDRQPRRLRSDFQACNGNILAMKNWSPMKAFSVVAQARADGILEAKQESRILEALLRTWARTSL